MYYDGGLDVNNEVKQCVVLMKGYTMEISIDNIGKEQDDYLKSFDGKSIDVPWCNEVKLGKIVREIFPNEEVESNKTIKLNDINFRPDYSIASKRIAIEFQGYPHFTDPYVVNRDLFKKKAFEQNGWTFLELPYFVQPNKT